MLNLIRLLKLYLFIGLLLLGGCATFTFSPQSIEKVPFKERAVTITKEKITVTVAVLSKQESKAIYGVDLYDEGIQPVWIEIESKADGQYWLLPSGLDEHFFSPHEASWKFHSIFSFLNDQKLDDHFDELQFRNPINKGSITSGFYLTNLDNAIKYINIDLNGPKPKNFNFTVTVPGLKTDYLGLDLNNVYPVEKIVNYENDKDMRNALESLPCCTTSKDGTQNGDPVNLIVIGTYQRIFPYFVRRGWQPTEVIHSGSSWQTIKSFIFASKYLNSPISRLYLFGRPQDLSGQQARGSIHQRMHLRFWLAPFRYHGKNVFVGQISRDIGIKFSTKTLLTHKIDPDVDESRYFLTQDLLYSQGIKKIGWVNGAIARSRDDQAYNLGNDPYYTDGLRVVIEFSDKPMPRTDITYFNWEEPEEYKLCDCDHVKDP